MICRKIREDWNKPVWEECLECEIAQCPIQRLMRPYKIKKPSIINKEVR